MDPIENLFRPEEGRDLLILAEIEIAVARQPRHVEDKLEDVAKIIDVWREDR